MARRDIVCGIDVGNSAVKTIIAELNRETLRPHVLGVGSAPSSGLRRGMVIDMEEAIHNISQSLEQAQTMAGVKVDQAYVSLNGLHIRTQVSHGIVAVSRADSEISQSDIDRVVDAASVISLPQNREVIHILPKNFVIDSQEHVRNPLGMKGVRLEADVLIIDGLSTYIRNIAKCVNANDVEVIEFVYAPLALSKAILNKHQREHGVLSLDIGGGISTLSMFYEGELVHTGVVPIGSRHITNDLAIALRTSMDIAEDIKKEHGFLPNGVVSKKDTVDLSEALGEDEFIIPKRQIAEVINARTSEIFDKIITELKKADRHMIPAGVVMSGGGSNMLGISEFVKNRMRMAVKIGGDYFLEGIRDQIVDPAFAVAVGLVVWGIEGESSDDGSRRRDVKLNGGIKKVANWFKNFIP
ncbi:MAG: cell division protein FtsA [bacterium]|nr:cell division protein FtsA [bacterium]